MNILIPNRKTEWKTEKDSCLSAPPAQLQSHLSLRPLFIPLPLTLSRLSILQSSLHSVSSSAKGSWHRKQSQSSIHSILLFKDSLVSLPLLFHRDIDREKRTDKWPEWQNTSAEDEAMQAAKVLLYCEATRVCMRLHACATVCVCVIETKSVRRRNGWSGRSRKMRTRRRRWKRSRKAKKEEKEKDAEGGDKRRKCRRRKKRRRALINAIEN